MNFISNIVLSVRVKWQIHFRFSSEFAVADHICTNSETCGPSIDLGHRVVTVRPEINHMKGRKYFNIYLSNFSISAGLFRSLTLMSATITAVVQQRRVRLSNANRLAKM